MAPGKAPALLVLLACAIGVALSPACDFVIDDDDSEQGPDDDAWDDDAADDDDATAPEERCDGWWEDVPEWSDRVYVDAAVEEGGDGSLLWPVRTLGEGLGLARAGGIAWVLVFDGEYQGTAAEPTFRLGPGDDYRIVAGCGADTVVAGTGQTAPVFEVSGDVDGVALRSLRTLGGGSGVLVAGGAGAGAQVELSGVTVWMPERLGIELRDAATQAGLHGVVVGTVDPADGGLMGYGILAASAGAIVLDDVLVEGAARAGIVVHDTPFEMHDVTVSNTRSRDGWLGRGVQVQEGASGTWSAGLVSGNADAGVFLFRAGAVDLEDLRVEATQLAAIEEEPSESAGAGLAATSNLFLDPGEPVEQRHLSLRGCTFADNARLGVLAEGLGVSLTAEGNVFSDNFIPDEETFPIADTIWFQRGAEVEVVSGEPAIELTGDLEQPMHRLALPVSE